MSNKQYGVVIVNGSVDKESVAVQSAIEIAGNRGTTVVVSNVGNNDGASEDPETEVYVVRSGQDD
jgi:hypothetical protein